LKEEREIKKKEDQHPTKKQHPKMQTHQQELQKNAMGSKPIT
jgi:hypothetical protein